MIPGFRLIRRLVLFAVIVGALFVVANQWVKAQGEKRIAQAIDKNFGVKGAQVSIDDFPVLVHIFSGKLSALSISADDVTVHGLQLRTLRVRLDDLHVTGGILGGGKLAVTVGHGTLSLQVTQGAITSYLVHHGNDARIVLREGDVVLNARRSVGGRPHDLDALGSFVLLRAGTVLRFVPKRVLVDGTLPPKPIEDEAKRKATFDVAIPKLPGGIKPETVVVHAGVAGIAADFNNQTLSLVA